MATIVLIHGAFHGGWCWRETTARLRAEGHEVYAPSLSGLADRSHLLSAAVDLDFHIQDIVNLIAWEDLREVVLVGHSYGGMPITGAADRIAGRLSALVYLDAMVPEDGQSAWSIRTAGAVAYQLQETPDGLAIAPPPPAVFGLTGALGEQAAAKLTPHPKATMTQPIQLSGAWSEVPKKLYIRASQFTAPYFDRPYEAAAADPSWVAVRRDAPHNLMMTEPDWFVGQLRRHAL
jgi:pimeloyl-ACP methyl ester carboxylesterase